MFKAKKVNIISYKVLNITLIHRHLYLMFKECKRRLTSFLPLRPDSSICDQQWLWEVIVVAHSHMWLGFLYRYSGFLLQHLPFRAYIRANEKNMYWYDYVVWTYVHSILSTLDFCFLIFNSKCLIKQ